MVTSCRSGLVRARRFRVRLNCLAPAPEDAVIAGIARVFGVLRAREIVRMPDSACVVPVVGTVPVLVCPAGRLLLADELGDCNRVIIIKNASVARFASIRGTSSERASRYSDAMAQASVFSTISRMTVRPLRDWGRGIVDRTCRCRVRRRVGESRISR